MLVSEIEIVAIRFECNWFDRAWWTVEIRAEKAVGSLSQFLSSVVWSCWHYCLGAGEMGYIGL